MQRIISLLLCLCCTAALLTGCAANAEQRTGEAQGYGGPLRVTVSMNGEDITAVKITAHSETEGVGTRAIDALPELIVRADSVQVDNVTGATITSEAIKDAVSQAVSGVTMPDFIDMDPMNSAAPMGMSGQPASTGVGMSATGRLGPGTDENDTPVRSFNVVFAAASFDEAGRILNLDVDQLEVLSSQFSGFPANAENDEAFLSQVSQWRTKGMARDDYMLGSGSWRQQMDAYEDMMTGMTIQEVDSWFSSHFSPETGKPLKSGEEGAPADVITGPTMSLRDEHGDILTAIHRAWEDAQSSSSAPTDGVVTDTNTNTDATDGGETFG